jgi:hypothetical protein
MFSNVERIMGHSAHTLNMYVFALQIKHETVVHRGITCYCISFCFELNRRVAKSRTENIISKLFYECNYVFFFHSTRSTARTFYFIICQGLNSLSYN